MNFSHISNVPGPYGMNSSPEKGLFGKFSQFLQYSYGVLVNLNRILRSAMPANLRRLLR